MGLPSRSSLAARLRTPRLAVGLQRKRARWMVRRPAPQPARLAGRHGPRAFVASRLARWDGFAARRWAAPAAGWGLPPLASVLVRPSTRPVAAAPGLSPRPAPAPDLRHPPAPALWQPTDLPPRPRPVPTAPAAPLQHALGRLPGVAEVERSVRAAPDGAAVRAEPGAAMPTARLDWPPPAGVPLAPPLRGPLERLLGADLGAVRLHADSAAAALAGRLGAHAFTVEQHVFFGAGRFQPRTRPGLGLLVHELAHVRQQPDTAPIVYGRLSPTLHRALEREADSRARSALAAIAPPRRAPGGEGLPPSGLRPPVRRLTGSDGMPAPGPGGPAAAAGGFPPLTLVLPARTMAVTPLRQEASAPLAAPVAAAEPPPGWGAPPPAALDAEEVARQVYTWIARRLRLENERAGVQRWR